MTTCMIVFGITLENHYTPGRYWNTYTNNLIKNVVLEANLMTICYTKDEHVSIMFMNMYLLLCQLMAYDGI